MTTQVAPLKLRLFAEGLEIPCVAAQVTIQPGQPALAALQVVPADTALLLLPRTTIHLFYLDPKSTEQDTAPAFIEEHDAPLGRYRLLFCGEVVGFNYQKNPNSRSMVLHCMDLSSYWDACYQWFADYSVNGDAFTDAMHYFVGAGEGLFDNVADGARWVVGDILSGKPENPAYKNTEGLLAGYIHLLEAIGGLRPKANSYDGFRGANDFFTIAELRYNLSGMLGAVADDKTSQKMYSDKAFLDWLQTGMASAGSLVSFRDILRLVGQYIYHDVYPNPAAMHVPEQGNVKRTLVQTFKESRAGPEATRVLQQVLNSLIALRTTLTTAEGDTNGVITLPTTQVFGTLQLSMTRIQQAISLVERGGTTDGGNVVAALTHALERVSNVSITARANSNEVGVTSVKMSPQNAELAARGLDLPLENIQEILNLVVTTTKIVEQNVTLGAHLYNQLLLPETYFVSPPRCNVVFPDQYFQFSYSRNFMQEVSRLMMHSGMGMLSVGAQRGDAVLTTQYFAPNITSAEKAIRKSVFMNGSLLPHEVHSGIIPKVEWITEGQRWGLKAVKTQGKEPKELQKIGYIQRLSNFQFFLHRFQARTMNCTMRFNPMMVLGFPGVVIDNSRPSIYVNDAVSSVLDSGLSFLPTAYIGKVGAIVHDINQQGGTTSVAYSHARTHRGLDDEFLGVVARERKDLVTETIVIPVIDTLNSSGDVDPFVKEVIRQYMSGTFVPNSDIQGKRVLSVTPGPVQEVSVNSFVGYGFDVDVVLGWPGLTNGVFRAPSTLEVKHVIKTDLGKFITPDSAFPPEVLLQPGWYADVWNSENITKSVYLPLLGCGAVTDENFTLDTEGFAGLLVKVLDFIPNLSKTTVGRTIHLAQEGRDIAVFEIKTGTVEHAIDSIVAMYGVLKKDGLDVQAFIEGFTRRPIATLVDVLGTPNFELDDEGNMKEPTLMREGFHSRASGDYNSNVKYRNAINPVGGGEFAEGVTAVPGDRAFLGLVPKDKEDKFVRRIGNKGKALKKIPPELDPRGRAFQRVLAYYKELSFSRGLSST